MVFSLGLLLPLGDRTELVSAEITILSTDALMTGAHTGPSRPHLPSESCMSLVAALGL